MAFKLTPVFGNTTTNADKGFVCAIIYFHRCKYTFKRQFPNDCIELSKTYKTIGKWLESFGW